MAMAGEHGFNQYLFDAEEALLRLDVETPPRKAPADISLDTQEVALAIKELRRSVGV